MLVYGLSPKRWNRLTHEQQFERSYRYPRERQWKAMGAFVRANPSKLEKKFGKK